MSSPRLSSLEMGRVLAIIAVVIIHAGPLRGDAYSQTLNTMSDIINQLCRFAVPFFFLLTGYFIQPKLLQAPKTTFVHYAKPLMLMWIVWSVFYILMPTRFDRLLSEGYLTERTGYWNYLLEKPFNTLFEGGMVHLWYIPALLSALGIMSLLISKRLQALMLPLALGLYVWGLSAGSYQPIFDAVTPIFSRNGPFFSLLMVVAGFEIHRRNITFKTPVAIVMFLGGFLLCLIEGFLLSKYGTWMATHDFLLGTPIMAIGLFTLLLNYPNIANSPLTFALSKRTLGIYVSHFIVMVILFNIFGAYSIEGVNRDLLLAPLTLFLSFALVLLLEKLPFTRFLVQMNPKTRCECTQTTTSHQS